MIKYSDLPALKQDKSIKSQIAAHLLEKGGLLPAHDIVRALQSKGILPDTGTDASYKRAKYLLYHHTRESYYLQREKGDIIRLIPGGKDDPRLWSNPLDAPDLTAFIFSLCVVRRGDDLNYKQAVPWIREYIARYENQYHEDCPGKSIVSNARGENLYYTVKKQAKQYMKAKGIV